MLDIVECQTLADAVDVMRDADGDAKYLGGGTALVLLLRMGLVAPKKLVSLGAIVDVEGWRDITVADDHLRLGGGVALDRVARSPLVQRNAPGLSTASGVVGNIRIRNAATVGGLLAEADYASDPPAVLAAVDAIVEIGDGRTIRHVAMVDFIEDFYTTALADEEVVTGLLVPITPLSASSAYRKFCARSAEDRPCVGTAVSAEFAGDVLVDLRVVVGAVAGKPQWHPHITKPHLGQRLTESVVYEIADAYASEIDPIEDVRGTAWYRQQVIRAEVARALLSLAAERGHVQAQ